MADLIAQGEASENRWRKTLPERQKITIGRSNSDWSVPWDEHISREHVSLSWNGEQLVVEQLPNARNRVYLRGQALHHFSLIPGQHFVIGQTSFNLVEGGVEVSLDVPEPLREQAFSKQFLQHVGFRQPDLRIHSLSSLPDLISSASDDRELFQRLGNVLLTGVPSADAAAIVMLKQEKSDVTDTMFANDELRRIEQFAISK